MPMTPEWRARLVPATFRSVEFKVEVRGRASGRRSITNEYPKRDTPSSEDMGRRARRYQITGYVVGPDYVFQRDDLIAAMEAEGSGLLILPTGEEAMVTPGEYTVRESRRTGGMAEFDLNFNEAGEDGFDIVDDTLSIVESGAQTLQGAATDALDTILGGL
jgi:prophage DNA circulation protein